MIMGTVSLSFKSETARRAVDLMQTAMGQIQGWLEDPADIDAAKRSRLYEPVTALMPHVLEA
jgi:hypothetical protein